METIYFLIQVGLMIGVCHMVISQMISARKQAKLENDIDELKLKIFDAIPRLRVEKLGNTFYLYENGTDKFQGQASTIDELAQEYNSTLAIVQYDNEEIVFLDGKNLGKVDIIVQEVE